MHILKKVQSFLTFDHSRIDLVQRRFQQIHDKRRATIPNWPHIATRHKIVSDFWFRSIIHYASIAATVILILLIIDLFSTITLLYFFPLCAFIIYIPLYLLVYRPIYFIEFLPRLEIVIKEQEDAEKSWAAKCKQEQLSIRGLVLFYYIFDKCAEVNYLTPSDKSASLLLKIFGVSQKGLKNELDLLYKKEKRAKIEQRKQTEIAKSFEEVYAIFEEMQFPKGIQMLKELEIRFNRSV